MSNASPYESSVSREVGEATVTLRLDSPLRAAAYRIVDLIDLWIGGPGGRSPSLQIQVSERDSGRTVGGIMGMAPARIPLVRLRRSVVRSNTLS